MLPATRIAGALLLLIVLLVAPAAFGGEIAVYSKAAFQAAQDSGKPIVVFVNASWCVTCRRQRPVVDTLVADPAFARTTVFVLDYDKDKDALRDLAVRDRSTLIAFNGKTERARSSFVTDPGKIRALFESAL